MRSLPQTVLVNVSAEQPALRLKARLCRSESENAAGAVIAPPHPVYGGSIDNPVLLRIEEGLRKASLTTLAFNYRGVDGSEGRVTDDLVAATTDYAAAHAHLTSLLANPACVATGYSFGAGTALLHARDAANVRGLVLVAPPVGMLRVEDLVACTMPLLVIVGDDDEYAPIAELTALLEARTRTIVEVITGADHFFHCGGMSEIDKLVTKHVASWNL